MARRTNPLTVDEIQAAFHGPWADSYPPVLTPDQLALLCRVSKKTIYGWSSEGRLDAAKFRAGKHLRFWRDRALISLFNNPW
ncbi:helix-turn-helix domain-containing protein [Zavarzinella formosa]|uniref:helix-turn-helix domain-containing protein n=1 Tax=Zavarzinella formosa TaxID=360055 RepID=UPI0002F66997|nr:helix-turn-helix domain-containing protein [Zavarzinella formosa]